jgi:uncharacterized membrane protein YdjX (TVP38/TMEM64 family)
VIIVYIESSPRNDRLIYLSRDDVRLFLDEAMGRDPQPSEIGFTGGEPFMNPAILDMIADSLSAGFRVLVLTNAMNPMQKPRGPLAAPGATIMTIAGGLLFGLWLGAALSVFGATTGAVILFVLARFVVGDALRARSSAFITRMAEGFERNAFNYLLFLRLVPLFPFWAVNLAPAALGVPLRSFALATLIGIIPGTLAFASMGDGLSLAADAHGSAGEIAGLAMIAVRVGLALLALVPVVAQWLGRRRAR